MKKKEIIKQKSKVKNPGSIKWFAYARYASLALVVLLLVLVGIILMMNHMDFEELVKANPFIGLSFLVASENLLAWYVLRDCGKQIQNLEHLERAFVILCSFAIIEMIMMNLMVGILLMIGLVSCFNFKQFSFPKLWKQGKIDHQIKRVFCILAVQFFFGYTFLSFAFLLS